MKDSDLQELIESISLRSNFDPERILRLKQKLGGKKKSDVRVEVERLFKTPPEKK